MTAPEGPATPAPRDGPRSMDVLEDHLVRTGGWSHRPVAWIQGRQVPTLFLCRGERVLHVGCADNLGLRESLPMGRHLHAVLEQTEPHVMGVDIDRQAVERLREAGLKTVEVLDVTSPAGLDRAIAFGPTVILLPEVIEHIDDAGSFLKALRRVATATGARLVLTTPNAFSGMARHYSNAGYESVNPDHRYFFSRATLERLLEMAGWRAEKWWGYSYHPPPRGVNQAAAQGYAEFAAGLRKRFPALDQLMYPSKEGKLVMVKDRPWWNAVLHRGDRVRYEKPFEYDGLIVVARPFED